MGGICGSLHGLLSVTWRVISYVKVERLRHVNSSPFSANKLIEHIPAKVKVCRFSSCSQFIRQVLALLSCFFFMYVLLLLGRSIYDPTPGGGWVDSYWLDVLSEPFEKTFPNRSLFCRFLWKMIPTSQVLMDLTIGGFRIINGMSHSFIPRLAGFSAEKGARTPDGLTLISKVRMFSFFRWLHKLPRIGRLISWSIIRGRSPNIIVLELGSTDLTKLPAQAIGSELETLVRYLHDEFTGKALEYAKLFGGTPISVLRIILKLSNFICI